MSNLRTTLARAARAARWTSGTVLVAVLTASPAAAAEDPGTAQLKHILGNATTWLTGILVAIATLFLTIGGVRYLMAGGDPGEIEKAKGSFKSALIGYALAALAPMILTIVKAVLGIK